MDPFSAAANLKVGSATYKIYRLDRLSTYGSLERLPYSIRIILESVLRNVDGRVVTEQDVVNLAKYNPKQVGEVDLPFMPARVVLQDFTGVPAVVDLAAMRTAMKAMGGDPKKINPLVPVDLVIDHSVQVDAFASNDALRINMEKEFERNRERYEFLHWGQKAFDNFRVVPPATGIVHQVNLEYLAKVVLHRDGVAMPDTLVGTDSHTVMINGLGVVGWGVGGIEAEAVMLGQPIYMLTPEVVGFKLTGRLSEGVTGTDLVLTITQRLRQKGVVGKFVEFFGDALDHMTLPVKAMIGNMAPEYGATMGFFPVDDSSLRYLRLTGRPDDEVALVEAYTKEQGLFRTPGSKAPEFADILELDISKVEPSLSGPKRPQDRVGLRSMKQEFESALGKPIKERGFELDKEQQARRVAVRNGYTAEMGHGAVVIAAITSCTNTSDPYVLIASGLLAKKAVDRGLKVKPYVKTSLAPGSRVVIEYLNKAGLMEPLEKLGFHNVGFGCTTCIGNSGPLPEPVVNAIQEGDLVAAAVLSGNRNFEGRVNPHTRANYLASPPLVVAYALAGTVDIDLTKEPIGVNDKGEKVYLKDIWPTQAEIEQTIHKAVTPELFRRQYASVFEGNPTWNAIKGTDSELYQWKESSTYIQEPPFFQNMTRKPEDVKPITDARVLALLGDSITTDHISPAGTIKADSPAGKFLQSLGVTVADFNSYGSRRGNDRVMTRGTFANIRLRNLLVPGSEGGITVYHPTGETMSIYDASAKYLASGTDLIVLAGKDYGMGSSRDWAAKGTRLLGVKALIAESYERIHRSNLIGMGILPLQFKSGESVATLGLTGKESYTIEGLSNGIKPHQTLTVRATGDGPAKRFDVTARIDTAIEVDYYRHGGILQMVLRQLND
ncbi:MAG: aconitate hydratase AcnA [candidate division Zixibacteria bacterium]|jgi:aconitate hydratase|nr:aconitate hydratase AcnA [candidate division Zixibacteria bacterium]